MLDHFKNIFGNDDEVRQQTDSAGLDNNSQVRATTKKRQISTTHWQAHAKLCKEGCQLARTSVP
jgi:hypothetical protein